MRDEKEVIILQTCFSFYKKIFCLLALCACTRNDVIACFRDALNSYVSCDCQVSPCIILHFLFCVHDVEMPFLPDSLFSFLAFLSVEHGKSTLL